MGNAPCHNSNAAAGIFRNICCAERDHHDGAVAPPLTCPDDRNVAARRGAPHCPDILFLFPLFSCSVTAKDKMTMLRVGLLLACCTVCAFATETKVENENTTMDPFQNVNESFSKLDTEACATALLCLWLEVVQLPRKRMIERIDTVFKQFVDLVNISAERAMLEEDETFTNSYEARDVLRGMRSKLETAEELTKQLENGKTELLTELTKDDAVVGDMALALSSVSAAAAKFAGTQQQVISIPNAKQMVAKMNNSTLGKQIANNITKLIMQQWWDENTSFLVQNLQTLINKSSDICGRHLTSKRGRKGPWVYSVYGSYSDVIVLASSGRKDLVKYMQTISGIDGLDGRDRNVSASLTKLLPSGNLSRVINATARDIVKLRDVKTQLRKTKAIYVATVQRERETVRLSGCTDLWKQLLTLVGWR
ncbi:hypothetical protein, conserved in T.vivax [Trypanosoma vivax Y486]|uniref:Uncharacterized protein n=1 Tax=Trypanosoma vivax (strain Y486) TaxID=1055687 RepID=F9WT91_TRYVY|nr:hypothetical protein, conserved in T.vivax [Trypanosoma vivax Y486]|eukprot:CCD20784.1 hypothetical protein, conserved in T.vivax [Trypanosoma vivax Y486]